MPQSVFNPFCKQDKSKDAVIQDWPYQSDIEIKNINKTNLFIKEVTNKSREDTRLKKEQKEREEREAKMKQPKKVQRRVQEDIECTETQLLLTIDMKAINEELAAGVKESVPEKKQDEDVKMDDLEVEDNKDDEQKKEDEEMKEEPKPEGQVAQETEEPALNKNVQFEEKEVKFTKKQTRVYEETITYEEYLKEFKPEQKLEKIEPKVQRVQAQDYKYLQSRDQEQQQGLLSISYKNTDTLKNLIISPMQRAIQMEETIKTFKVIVPKVVAKPVNFVLSKIYTQQQKDTAFERFMHQKLMQHRNVNQSLKYSNFLFFPHKNLIQYDCGKLQKLAQLLKTLYNKGSKVIIFT